jgi:hypothetical protein
MHMSVFFISSINNAKSFCIHHFHAFAKLLWFTQLGPEYLLDVRFNASCVLNISFYYQIKAEQIEKKCFVRRLYILLSHFYP